LRTTWIVGLLVAYLGGAIIDQTLMYQAEYISTEATHSFFGLLQPSFTEGGGIPLIGFFIVVWEWIQFFWYILSWDFGFLQGNFEILRYVLWCISTGIIVSFVLAIRGTGSV